MKMPCPSLTRDSSYSHHRSYWMKYLIGILVAFIVALPSLAAAPSSFVTGGTYDERSGAFIRYLAAATPRNANFPK
jgi:hypothetical protein